MRKMIFFLIAIAFLFFTEVYAAECEIVMDADSGRVLYGQNIEKRRLIASTTKIMTAFVTLNNVDLKEEVIVGDEVLEAYGSAIYIKPQEKLTVEDLLYGLMLRSGNDAALVLAKYVAGSQDAFASLMNETARAIGMNDTEFFNPHGLDEKTQNKSTVYDMALLMREAMKNENFRTITSAQKYSLKTNFNTYEWYNKNRLLTDYKYATGGKIGYTTAAKHTFVSSATKDGKNLIVATFVDSDRFVTHANLYEKYFDDYKKYEIIDKDNLNINYKSGYRVFTLESFSMLLKDSEKDKIVKEVTLYDDVKIGSSASIVGSVAITMDGKTYKKMKIFAERLPVEKRSWFDRLRGIFKW